MIWRIRARSDFSRLSANGTRARAGVLWCTYLLDPPGPAPDPASQVDPARPGSRPNVPSPPRVAFALGRAVGPAVVRNRLRRQLKAILQDELSAAGLPSGMYLFGARPAAVSRSFTELQFDLAQLLRRVRG